MILLYIQFDPSGYGKTYKYLLVNPGHYKIDNTKPLVYYQGATAKGPITHIMYATKAEKVTVLPTVVSKQIVLLDEHNHVEIQTLGKTVTSEISCPKSPKPPKTSRDRATPDKTLKNIGKEYSHSEIIDKMIQESLSNIDSYTHKLLIKRR